MHPGSTGSEDCLCADRQKDCIVNMLPPPPQRCRQNTQFALHQTVCLLYIACFMLVFLFPQTTQMFCMVDDSHRVSDTYLPTCRMLWTMIVCPSKIMPCIVCTFPVDTLSKTEVLPETPPFRILSMGRGQHRKLDIAITILLCKPIDQSRYQQHITKKPYHYLQTHPHACSPFVPLMRSAAFSAKAYRVLTRWQEGMIGMTLISTILNP
jgi:hypothetical protein